MPYLTPDEIPEDDDCRPLSIPASSDWLAIVSGALTELTKEWNWQQQGAVTVAEAVARMQTMIDAYYDGCATCNLPGGSKVVRINERGEAEELAPGGEEWQPVSGDYVIPPPPAREGGTADDQICDAAANAANVLKLLYEDIADSAAAHLELAEAIAAFLIACIGLIGVAAGVLAAALVALAEALFAVIFGTAEFVLADLWTSDFDKQMVCILKSCATNDAGVVTFDWDCFWNNLAEQTNAFDLTSEQLRLYAQIMIIVQFIGGVAAINAAGGTTAIADADCSDCGDGWCITVDFTLHDGGFDSFFGEDYGVWSSGVGWIATDTSIGADRTIIEAQAPLGATFHVTKAEMIYDSEYSECSDAGSSGTGIGYGTSGNGFEFTNTSGSQDVSTGTDLVWSFDEAHDVDEISMENQVAFLCHGGSSTIKRYTLWGTGDAPVLDGWEAC